MGSLEWRSEHTFRCNDDNDNQNSSNSYSNSNNNCNNKSIAGDDVGFRV